MMLTDMVETKHGLLIGWMWCLYKLCLSLVLWHQTVASLPTFCHQCQQWGTTGAMSPTQIKPVHLRAQKGSYRSHGHWPIWRSRSRQQQLPSYSPCCDACPLGPGKMALPKEAAIRRFSHQGDESRRHLQQS